MGGLAALAREAGHQVTGCDTGVYPPMSEQLRALGIELIEGYGVDQLAQRPDMFVIGNVVSRQRLADGQPRYALMDAILDAGARYTSGPQWLAENILRGRHVLAVAGTHGKTSTTSMLAWILECADHKPGFLVGGVPLNFGLSARLGVGKTFVIEADEYDTAFFDKRSKFLHYAPRTAVLNNLEFDHADIFDDLAAIERQFQHLLRIVPPSGRVVVNGEDGNLRRVLQAGCWSEVKRFAQSGADYSFTGTPQDFEVLQGNPTPSSAASASAAHAGRASARVRWELSGLHNQMNALAAIAAAAHVGVPLQEAAQALANFKNVKRRMELRGSAGGVTVYDDFAHHPTAFRLTIEGLRQQVGQDARILAVFEPRTNTMQRGEMKALLAQSLQGCDLAFCHAEGLNWDPQEALAPLGQRLRISHSIPELVQMVCQEAKSGDHVLCMSNGGFGGVHQKLLDALGKTVGAAE